MGSENFHKVVTSLVLLMLLSFFVVLLLVPETDINDSDLEPVKKKDLFVEEKADEQIENNNSKIENITAKKNATNFTPKEPKITSVNGPYKILGISTIEEKLDNKRINLLWSQLDIEGKEHPNSFTIGYLINISNDLDEFFINASCKTAENEIYKFRDKLYSQDIFGDINPRHKCSVLYLTTKKPDLSRIRFAVLRPKKTGSKESILDHGFTYQSVEQNTYIVSFGFHSLDSVKKDKEMTCTLELNSNALKISKKFDLNYINNR